MTFHQTLAWLLTSSALCFSCLSLGACSEEPDDDGAPSAAEVPRVLEAIAEAQCERLVTCCSTQELTTLFAGVDDFDAAACQQALVNQTAAFLRPELESGVVEGRVRLDTEQLDVCTAAIRDTSCGDFEPVASVDLIATAACEALVVSALDNTGFCKADYECKSGFCSRPPAADEGTCKTPPQEGDVCLNDRCADSLRCAQENDTCRPKLSAGELCSRASDCLSERCNQNEDAQLVCEDVPEICTG